LLLDLPGLALVAGCLVLGLGLAAGGPPWLTAGERLVIGLVVAVVGLTMMGYVAALAIGVTVGLVLLLAVAALIAGGWLLWRHRGRYDRPAFSRRSGAPFVLPAAVTVLALSGLILWARRLTSGIAAGVIAVTLTLLGGGIGFLLFFGDAARPGLINALTHITRSYDRSCPLANVPPDPSCLDATLNIQWYNPILSYYLPQRSFVFGAAMVMAVLLLLTPPLLATPLFRWRETIATVRSSWRRWTLKSE